MKVGKKFQFISQATHAPKATSMDQTTRGLKGKSHKHPNKLLAVSGRAVSLNSCVLCRRREDRTCDRKVEPAARRAEEIGTGTIACSAHGT
jgi:hypothetical protein